MTFMKTMQIGNEKLREELKDVKDNMNNQNKEVKEELVNLSKKVDKSKEDLIRKDNKDRKIFEKMNDRMNKLEVEMTRSIAQKERREEVKRREEEKEKREREATVYSVDQSHVRQKEREACKERVDEWWNKAREMNEKDKEQEENEKKTREDEEEDDAPEIIRQCSYKSNWAQIMENEMEDKMKKKDEEDERQKEEERRSKEREGKRRENDKQNREREEKRKAIERESRKVKAESEKRRDTIIGNPSNLHDSDDWSWDDSEEDWHGVIDKKERNRERKRKSAMKKKKILTETTAAASLIIGIHPVEQTSIDTFYMKSGNYTKAKTLAANEYLEKILLFDEEDMEDVKITDTQISKKGDDVLYIAVDKIETVIEIRKRIAERQNSEIFARNYIPPQYFARYCAMNNIAQDMRSENTEIKTQIRFGESDIEIWTKTRGDALPFKQEKISDNIMKDIPPFDYSIKWRKKVDKPPRRKLSPLVGRITVPSLIGRNKNTENRKDEDPAKRKKRIHSTSSEEEQRENTGMETDGSL